MILLGLALLVSGLALIILSMLILLKFKTPYNNPHTILCVWIVGVFLVFIGLAFSAEEVGTYSYCAIKTAICYPERHLPDMTMFFPRRYSAGRFYPLGRYWCEHVLIPPVVQHANLPWMCQ